MAKSQFSIMDVKTGQPAPHAVEIKPDATAQNRYSVTLEDAIFSADIEITERHAHAASGFIRSGKQSKPFFATLVETPSVNGNPQYHIWLNGHTFWLEKTSSAPKRSQGGGGSGAIGNIKAPMPGTVLKILVEEGQSVEANQAIVIMESMKMEMTLSAAAPAVVKKIAAQPNQLVAMNDTLVELQAAE